MKLESETLPGDVERIILEGRLDIDGSQAVDIRFTSMTTTRKGQFVVDLGGVIPSSPRARQSSPRR